MISYAIMAHPARAAMVDRLHERLPWAEIVWDRGEGEWDTGRRALLAFDPAAAYHAVIQDDAILSDRFGWALELVVAHAQGHALGLYVGRCRPAARLIARAVSRAQESGSPWLELAGGPWWGVGLAVPVERIPAMVAEADTYRHPLYDARVKKALKLAGEWSRYPVPSLLDHDPAVPSLLDSAGGNRRAYDFLGDRDPGEIEWGRPAVRVDQRGRITVPPST